MFKFVLLSEVDVIKYSHLCDNDPDCPVFYQISYLYSLPKIINSQLVIAMIDGVKEIECAIPGLSKGRIFETLTYQGFDSLDIIVNKGYITDLVKKNIINCILKKYDVIKLSNFISIRFKAVPS